MNFANDACCFFERVGSNPATGANLNGQTIFPHCKYSGFYQDDGTRPNLTINLGLAGNNFLLIERK